MIKKWFAVMFAVVLLSPWAIASEASNKLASRLSGLQTFEARFTQFIVDQSGARIQETGGEIRARRPGQFYWHASPPIEQYVVSDGKIVRVYDPDLAQVTEQEMDQRISSTPALLLSGDVKDLERSYDVTFRAIPDGREEYSLRPLDKESLFEVLQMWFKDGVLREMRLVDSLNQRSTILFDDVKVNTKLGDEAFRLDIPDGVDIIRATE